MIGGKVNLGARGGVFLLIIVNWLEQGLWNNELDD